MKLISLLNGLVLSKLLFYSLASAAPIDLKPVYQQFEPVELKRIGLPPVLNLSKPLTGSFAVELVFKFNEESFSRIEEGEFVEILWTGNKCLNLRISRTDISIFSTPQNPISNMARNKVDQLSLPLQGSIRRSLSYYLDFKEHHFVVQRDAVKGFLQLWIDGVAYTVAASPGALVGPCEMIKMSGSNHTAKLIGTLSKVAVYDRVLDRKYIASHATNRSNSVAYDYKMAGNDTDRYLVNALTPQARKLDVREFVPGSVIPTVGNQTQGVNLLDPLAQFQNSPNPRYATMSTPFQKNFNWLGVYLSGYAQDWLQQEYNSKISNGATLPKYKIYALRKYAEIQKELASTFNYGVVQELNVSLSAVSASGPTLTAAPVVHNASNEQPIFDLMRSHPQFSRDFIMFGAFTNNLVNSSYWLNHRGPEKYLSPIAPKNLAHLNGQVIGAKLDYIKKYIDDAGAGNSNRTDATTFDRVNDNGEYAYWAPNAAKMREDPKVVQDEMSFSGSKAAPLNAEEEKKRWGRYRSAKLAEFVNALKDGVQSVAGNSFSYSLYNVTAQGDPLRSQGNPYGYEFLKKVNTGYSGSNRGCGENQCYYSTADFYPRSPDKWSFWSGAWHGLKWFENGHRREIAENDQLMSPFVSAGWSPISEENQTPSQYLGALKLLMALGSEFFYAGYFTLGEDFNDDGKIDFGDSRLWAWQALAPSYAQAAFSSVSDILRNGELLERTPGGTWESSNYRLLTSDPRVVVFARKLGSRTLIVTSIQPLSNAVGNAPMVASVTVDLAGTPIKLTSRRQGSIYLYDVSNPAKPTLKQLDAWHEAGHFMRWKKSIAMEAENPDHQFKYAYLETRFSSGKKLSFETTVRFKKQGSVMPEEWLQYSFQPRSNSNLWDMMVSAKSVDQKPATFLVRLMKKEANGWTQIGKEAQMETRSAHMAPMNWSPFGVNLDHFANYRMDIKALSENLAIDSLEIREHAFQVPIANR
jgi:hypothetical protein